MFLFQAKPKKKQRVHYQKYEKKLNNFFVVGKKESEKRGENGMKWWNVKFIIVKHMESIFVRFNSKMFNENNQIKPFNILRLNSTDTHTFLCFN